MIEIDFTFDNRDESVEIHGYLVACSGLDSEEEPFVRFGPSRYSKTVNKYLIPCYIGHANTELDFRIVISWREVRNHILTKRKRRKKKG